MTIEMLIGWPDELILAVVLFVLVVIILNPAVTFIQSLITGESQEEIKKREEEIRKKEHQQFIENQKNVDEQNKKKLHEALLELSDADFEKISSEIQNMSEEECIEQTGFGIHLGERIYAILFLQPKWPHYNHS